MNAFFLAVVVAVVAQSSGSGSGFTDRTAVVRSRQPAAASDRGFHVYQQQISALFKQESLAAGNAERAAAVRALCELHRDIVRDPRYATSPVLREYRGRLWSRLTRIKNEWKQELARDSKAGPTQMDEVAALETASRSAVLAADTLADSLSLLDELQGGPGSLLAFGGGAAPADNGLALVALIERTINPAFWDTAGGPGTIVYYAPLQCLVVRATAEVHGQIGGGLGGLRGGGK
jgi:hypothetical protein